MRYLRADGSNFKPLRYGPLPKASPKSMGWSAAELQRQLPLSVF
jgi:hypothetical protein